jgi:hypothetical protein
MIYVRQLFLSRMQNYLHSVTLAIEVDWKLH